MSPTARRRYIAIVVVGAFHFLILEMFVRAPPDEEQPPEEPTVWSTLFFVPADDVKRPPPAAVRPKRVSPQPTPQVQVPAPESASPVTLAAGQPTGKSSVDWMSELSGAAAAVMAVTGPPKDAAPRPGSIWTQPAHTAGEQYTLSTGELVVWVSDRCYIVSEPPMLGTPNSLAHLALTHTECSGGPGPRSDLFKDLPGYRKYHPAP